uniref:Uncharacterized protein n=2 Tax=Meloidogyne TaxID=189290 RepID=A0A6V7UK44_MELEN|nr:unnamed protein product [Meloidogyne enterolobii]
MSNLKMLAGIFELCFVVFSLLAFCRFLLFEFLSFSSFWGILSFCYFVRWLFQIIYISNCTISLFSFLYFLLISRLHFIMSINRKISIYLHCRTSILLMSTL